MQRIHVPIADYRYWAAILLASVFGTNLGDLYAHESGLGLQLGVVLLAVLTIPLFALERLDRRTHAVYYWLVIIVIRTGATNIADYLQFRVHIPQLPLCLALAAFSGFFGYWQQRASVAPAAVARTPGVLPESGAQYWLAMLGAGVFGTVLGDLCSRILGQLTASMIFTALLLVAIAFWRRTAVAVVAIYWITVAIARTAGTAIGDWLAESHALNFGLPLATLLSGFAFVGLLWISPKPGASTRAA
jgi:uncharacterized membrane-anchored protein